MRNDKSPVEDVERAETSKKWTPSYTNGKRPPILPHILIVAIITLAAAAVALFFNQKNHREIMRLASEQFNEQQLILACSVATGIETFIACANDDLLALSNLPSVQRMAPEMFKRKEMLYTGIPSRTSSRRLDKNGILRCIYPNESRWKNLIGRDYSRKTYFQTTKKTGRAVISGLITNEEGERYIMMARPVYIENRKGAKEFDGVVTYSFDPKALTDLFISPIISYETGYAWMLDGDGIFLAHHEKEFVGRDAFKVRMETNPELCYDTINNIQRRMMAGEEGTGRYISGWHRGQRGKVEKLISYAPVNIFDKVWSVAVCAPASEVEEITHKAHHNHLYTLGFIAFILTVAGVFFSVLFYRWAEPFRQDIERRRRAEKALRESEEILNAILSASPIGICLARNRIIDWANDAMYRMVGYEQGALLGKDVLVLYPDAEEYERVGQKLYSDIAESGTGMAETRWVRKDGTILDCIFMVQSLDDTDPSKGQIVAITDITEKKKTDEQLILADRLASLGQLSGGIAHEIRNPLTSISLFLDVLGDKEKFHRTDSELEILDEIRDNINKIDGIIKRVLNFAKPSIKASVQIDINAIIREEIKFWSAKIRNSEIKLELSFEDNVPPVFGDPIELGQVWNNLVQNALEVMEKRGTLSITTSRGMSSFQKDRPVVVIRVNDTGPGIKPEHRKNIFNPFFTTKTTGTGLGLAISQHIVKRHGGIISFESELDRGTTFTVELPIIEGTK